MAQKAGHKKHKTQWSWRIPFSWQGHFYQYFKFHLEKKHQDWKLLQQFATLEFPIRRSSWIKSLLALATWPYYQRHQVNWLRHFPTTVTQNRKTSPWHAFTRYDLWYTSGCAETIRNPALLIAWHAAASSSSRTCEKSTSEPVEIDVLAPCMAACFLTCLERVFHPHAAVASFTCECLTNTAGTGTWAVTNKEAYLITLKADILSANNQKLLLFPFQIQVFKQMGASLNGGTPYSHPKCWSLFSRKTNPWFCWVPTHHFSPKSPNLIQLPPFPRRLATKLDKDLLWAKPCLRIRVAWWLLRAKLTVCPVVLAKDLDTS